MIENKDLCHVLHRTAMGKAATADQFILIAQSPHCHNTNVCVDVGRKIQNKDPSMDFVFSLSVFCVFYNFLFLFFSIFFSKIKIQE